eukprot:gene11788-11933_t
MAASQGSNAVFYDEEDCLGFGVFAAELELIVGSTRDRKPDQVQLLELLQKLLASISTTDTKVVRNLVALCLSRLYLTGDLLPLFSRVNTLQIFLQDKNNPAPEVIRLSVLELLAHLESSMGRYLASSALESMTIAVKSSDELRAAAASLLGAICRGGGSLLWGTGGYYAEEALRLAVAGLEDAASQTTRESFALALAELASAARPANPCLAAALDAEKKLAKKQQLEKVVSGIFKAALVVPFVEAAMAGGEMPAPTAAVIYFIRVSVIRRLPEPHQRQLLSLLARATSHAIAPPAIVAAMEGCGVLLELLGEVHDEAAIKAVENAAMSKLSASSTAVRHQAAAVLAALALASPPLLALLFGECLEGVETFCQQLMLLAAPYTRLKASGATAGHAAAAVSSSTTTYAPGTPRGAPDSQTKHCIDGLHGNALAVGGLLVAAARSALGAPSRLTRSVFWIAKRMISQPYCRYG